MCDGARSRKLRQGSRGRKSLENVPGLLRSSGGLGSETEAFKKLCGLGLLRKNPINESTVMMFLGSEENGTVS